MSTAKTYRKRYPVGWEPERVVFKLIAILKICRYSRQLEDIYLLPDKHKSSYEGKSRCGSVHFRTNRKNI